MTVTRWLSSAKYSPARARGAAGVGASGDLPPPPGPAGREGLQHAFAHCAPHGFCLPGPAQPAAVKSALQGGQVLERVEARRRRHTYDGALAGCVGSAGW